MSQRILIIEDEERIARFLELELVYEGYQVEVEHNGKDGLARLTVEDESFSLVLLDLMLPEMDGIEVCRRVRTFSDIPVIMVTARDGVSSKVEGLDTGADDYITKPFAIEELLARIRALLRRKDDKDDNKELLTIADLKVDIDGHKVKRGEDLIELTKREYDLLVFLLKNKGRVLTREEILNKIWGYDYLGETNVVDVYIRYLRSKIDDPFEEKLIQTVRGVGYVIRDEQE